MTNCGFADDLLEFVTIKSARQSSIAGRRLIRDENGEWREMKSQ
jgi:hypothetical protein